MNFSSIKKSVKDSLRIGKGALYGANTLPRIDRDTIWQTVNLDSMSIYTRKKLPFGLMYTASRVGARCTTIFLNRDRTYETFISMFLFSFVWGRYFFVHHFFVICLMWCHYRIWYFLYKNYTTKDANPRLASLCKCVLWYVTCFLFSLLSVLSKSLNAWKR